MKKIITVLLASALLFTGLPLGTGHLEVEAASSYIKTLNAYANGQNSASLSWTKLSSKQKKKVTGIAIFRNGAAVKMVSKSTSSYTDGGLKAGTTYKYQVKTYKTKKVKQWYNKKTGKWQTKKPAKKYRGKSRKVTTYTYANASPVRTITTAAPVKYTITWKNWDGTVLDTATVEKGKTPSYSAPAPTKETDHDYAYDFTGWSPAVTAASANVEYTAQFKAVPIYTITWVDKSNNVLNASVVKEGTVPVFSGTVPNIDVDNGTSVKRYKFNNRWKNVQENSYGITPATCDTTYRAQYVLETLYKYTVTWKNYDGSVLQESLVLQDDTPSYEGETPTKPSDDTYYYTFSGWDPEITTVSGDKTYTAQFEPTTLVSGTFIDYKGIHIDMGQDWTSSLDSQLRNKSDGYCSFFSRPEMDVYLYNTVSYDPFLEIIVKDGKVMGWHTNGESFGTYQGVPLVRGKAKSEYPSGAAYLFSTSSFGCLMAGVGSTGVNRCGSDADERTIAYHFVNAARVAAGRSPLPLSEHLSGVTSSGENLTWSGTPGTDLANWPSFENVYLSNIRYGAQAWAETMKASKKVAHSRLQYGPLGYESCPIDAPIEEWDRLRNIIPAYASNLVYNEGENCGMGAGEDAVYVYTNSTIHIGTMLDAKWKYMGVGFSTGYHCESFSTEF